MRYVVLDTVIYTLDSIKQENLAELMTDFTETPMKAFRYLIDLESVYPNFYKWYHEVVLEDVRHNRNNRKLLIAYSHVDYNGKIKSKVTGIAIIKSNEWEKKICTFRVFSCYRRQGVGSKLLKKCFKELNTKTPLISISHIQVDAFKSIIKKYGWKRTQVLPEYYQAGVIEYVYNGYLKTFT